MYKITINGSGTIDEITKALQSIIASLPDIEKDILPITWEDKTLLTVIGYE